MDRQTGGQETDEEMLNADMQIEYDVASHNEHIVGQGFWNDFGDLLDDDELN